MAKKITVVISQGQSAHPEKRHLEEALVGALLMERGVEVTVIPNLYDLAPESTGMLCLQGITGDMIVASWLFPRAAHWTLDRNGIKGQLGKTLLSSESSDEDDDDFEEVDEATAEDADKPRVGSRNLPPCTIYHLHLAASNQPEPFLAEIKRIIAEASVQTVGLMGWISGTPKPELLDRYLNPAGSNGGSNAIAPLSFVGAINLGATGVPPVPAADSGTSITTTAPTRVAETPSRRWYPVIDYSRCTNCMECIDFCLFGVYGLDPLGSILVEQQDSCKKGCPACSRVCPANAIVFPGHKTPAIAGADGEVGDVKIDLSKLFGAPSAVELAARERDVELVRDGRDTVCLTIGIPKRLKDKPKKPRDELDDLIDSLDALEL
jgi:NAD-dependent dihydropyrimidine dehydrogenase PreA subunit